MIRFAAAALALASAFAAAPPAEARSSNAPAGSYQATCRDYYVSGDTLYGECRTDRGKWKKTWISGFKYCDGDIINNNGVMDCRGGRLPEDYDGAAAAPPSRDGLPEGAWRDTCREAVIDGSVLRASCRDRAGTWRPTWIDMRQCSSNTLANEDGLLVCVAAAPRHRAPEALRDTLPSGSWLANCRAGTVRQFMMRAECYQGDGVWVTSDLNLKTCRSGSVASRDGRLVCN